MQVAAAFRGSFGELFADVRLARTEGLAVKPPAKGLRRSVLCGGWLLLHIFELVVLLVYGAFPRGPVHATWWFLATLAAGVLYVRVCFSDPGFLSPLTVQASSGAAPSPHPLRTLPAPSPHPLHPLHTH